MRWWMAKLESSASFIIYDKCDMNVDPWVLKIDNLYENKEKTAQEQKTQGNSEFFIMNLKDNHNTWKFVLWLQHMLMYFQLLE